MFGRSTRLAGRSLMNTIRGANGSTWFACGSRSPTVLAHFCDRLHLDFDAIVANHIKMAASERWRDPLPF
jgi:hypothetical protein